MSLRITKNIEPIQVSRIVLCLYGVPGLGKTSTAFTAEKPILLDFDRGAHRSRNRGDSVQVAKWEDILAITAEDMKPYKTVVIDTATGSLLNSLRGHEGGVTTLDVERVVVHRHGLPLLGEAFRGQDTFGDPCFGSPVAGAFEHLAVFDPCLGIACFAD